MGNIIVTSEEELKRIVKECFESYMQQHPQFQQQPQKLPEIKAVEYSPLMTVKEAAEYLKVHTRTIERLLHDGELQAVKVNGTKISLQELNNYMQKKTY